MLLQITLIVFLFHPALVIAQQAAAAAYAPTFTPCPSGTTLIRPASSPLNSQQSLSSSESAYMSAKKSKVLPGAWNTYVDTLQKYTQSKHLSFPPEISSLLSSASKVKDQPTLGIALSGGGYRAAIFGAAVLNTFDSRNTTSVHAGLGGLLQSATYLSGLSGGSWLIGALSQADFPTLPELVFGPSSPSPSLEGYGGFNAQTDLTAPTADPTAYIQTLIEEISGKFLRGFPVTFADVWARTLSRHFVNGTLPGGVLAEGGEEKHGAGITWSSVTRLSSFASHAIPFPIIVSDSLSKHANTHPNSQAVSNATLPLANVIYEFNPFEAGSFDPQLSAFTPTQFLGSPNSSLCVKGYDQMSFVQAMSSDLFNEFNVSAGSIANSTIGPVIAALQSTLPQTNIELDASVLPNPFFNFKPSVYPDSSERLLTLVDGGEDGEVMPIQPLLVKPRDVDVIVAVDSAADSSDNYSEGFSLIASAQRASLFGTTYPFPRVPNDVQTFTTFNLAKRPTFFGCNPDSYSGSSSSLQPPLIIYIANGGAPLGQNPVTNTSTLQSTYGPAQIMAMFDQVFDIATQGIPPMTVTGTEKLVQKDPEWPVCLACAVVERARRRSGLERSTVCEQCLERYCWS